MIRQKKKINPVALLAESVDRNSGLMSVVRFATVALLAESVDRNNDKTKKKNQPGRSPCGERG